MKMKSKPRALETSNLRIRPFGRSDIADRYVSWLNDSVTVRYSEQRHIRHTRNTCGAYFEAMQERGDWFLAILRKRGCPEHIGNVGVALDEPNSTADMAIIMGEPDARGKGYGIEAWSAVLNDLVGRAGIRKVTAGTMFDNAPMMALAKRCGMNEESRQPRQFLLNGREVDLVRFSFFGTSSPNSK